MFSRDVRPGRSQIWWEKCKLPPDRPLWRHCGETARSPVLRNRAGRGASDQSRDQLRQRREPLDPGEARMGERRLGVLETPGQVLGHMHPPGAGLERRDHVGLEAVADHQRRLGAGAVAGEKKFCQGLLDGTEVNSLVF